MNAKWGPAKTTLQGMLRTEFRYGPPSYGLAPWQDTVETPIILTLQESFTVQPDPPRWLEGDFNAQGFADVSEVHVAVTEGFDKVDWEAVAGSMVELTGELFPAHTGHHHRPVLIACGAEDVRLMAPFHLANVPNARVFTTGSGILLNEKGHILTARHVAVGQALSVRRRLDRFEARLIAVHPSLDVAILQASIHCDHRTPLRQTLWPMLGERIFAAGYPLRAYLGHGVSFTEGVVSSDRLNEAGCFHFTAPVQPGNSGGPIFDAHGQLLAIVVAQAFPEGHRSVSDIRQIQLLNEAIPVGVLTAFLKQHQIDYDPSFFIHRIEPDAPHSTLVADTASKVCVEIESWSVMKPKSHDELDLHDLAAWF